MKSRFQAFAFKCNLYRYLEDFDASLEELMAYDKFTYRCDAAFLGQKGVLAMLPVLRADPRFTGLILRGCGLHNEGVFALASALAGHPTMAYLDVGNNPISEGGVEALTQLCAATPSLKDVLCDRCYFNRGWSNVSTDLNANPNTGRVGTPLFTSRYCCASKHGAIYDS